MIFFDRTGTQVRARVSFCVPFMGNRELYFYWECNSDILAGVLASRLNTESNEHIDKIMRDAYRQGWADAKAKRAKVW